MDLAHGGASSPKNRKSGGSGDSRSKADAAPFYEVKAREVELGELRASRRSMRQEMKEWEGPPSSTRTRGIPLIGPIRYPAGAKEKGKGQWAMNRGRDGEKGGSVRGGLPPGLFFHAAASALS